MKSLSLSSLSVSTLLIIFTSLFAVIYLAPAQAEPRYNPLTGLYEDPGPVWCQPPALPQSVIPEASEHHQKLKYNMYEDQWEYAYPDDKLRYNPYDDKWEYAPGDSRLRYNPYEDQWEYAR